MKGNSVSIKGNLTRNAEIRGISGDRACVAFGLAWNNNRLQADNTPLDQPHYFEVSCWMSAGQQNYFMPLLTKGTACSIIDGYLSYGTWMTKDGEKRSRVEIAVTDPFSSMTLLAPRKPRSAQTAINHEASAPTEAADGQTSTYTEVNPTDLQVPSGTKSPAASLQALSTSEATAPEDTCETELSFDTEELDPKELEPEDVLEEAPANAATENKLEADPTTKRNKASKTESTSSKKLVTA